MKKPSWKLTIEYANLKRTLNRVILHWCYSQKTWSIKSKLQYNSGGSGKPQESPQTTQAIAIAQQHGKTPLLETTDSSWRTQRNQSQRDLEAFTLPPSFHNAGRHQSSEPSCFNATSGKKWPLEQQWHSCHGVTNALWLELRPAPQQRVFMACSAILVKRTWLSGKGMGPRTETVIVILLNGHVVKWPSKYLFLYP